MVQLRVFPLRAHVMDILTTSVGHERYDQVLVLVFSIRIRHVVTSVDANRFSRTLKNEALNPTPGLSSQTSKAKR